MNRAKKSLLGALTALAFSFYVSSAVLSPEEAKAVSIKDLEANAAAVSGAIVNNTPHVIRDIEVLIQYHWLWANEFKPGLESPGRVASLKLNKDLLPGESTPFRYVPDPPLVNRQDGRFDPEVVIAGFTIVIPPTTTSR